LGNCLHGTSFFENYKSSPNVIYYLTRLSLCLVTLTKNGFGYT
jgi:hypothetical protein